MIEYVPVGPEIARVEHGANGFNDRLRKIGGQLLAKQTLERGVLRDDGLERDGVALERDVTAIGARRLDAGRRLAGNQERGGPEGPEGPESNEKRQGAEPGGHDERWQSSRPDGFNEPPKFNG